MRPFVLVSLIASAACAGGAPSRPDPAAPNAESPVSPAAAAAAAPQTATATATSPPSSASPPPPPPTADAPLARPPTTCADPSAPFCTPAGAFVERLCDKPHQDLALAMFEKATPFTRVYARGKLDELVTDEEVIVLRVHTPPKNGIVVGSGKGTYDVLRWDGSCSIAVEADMFTRTRPPRPTTAHVQWHRIGSATQDAIIAASDGVKRAHSRRGKECKGAMTGDVSAACAKADQALVDAVVEYVRAGGTLPGP